ncbi:DUF5067 domain-containing protein [Isobaculum melis]|uniref:DUF5067 domain-containing protein n=1 Tax=Isobaculum melis TaxID=142588 RepID=A0A1H9TD14_9LACT|nr:DUF5067 domain-containing protein [Isobaculum melis]SER94503.1 protein of unknown function [Isobaculum melis]
MKQLKKLGVLGFITLLSVVMVACGSSGSSDKGKEKESEKTEEKKATDSGELGDYSLTIHDGFELAKDYNDQDVIVLTYDFTNNSDENQSFMFSISDKVFQNGVGLESAIMSADSPELKNRSTEIQPGASLTVKVGYVLQDTTSPVSVEAKELISLDDNKLTKEFNLQ